MASATPEWPPADQARVGPVHAESLDVVWKRFGSRPGGLTAQEVTQRRRTTAGRAGRSRAAAVVGELIESLVEPLQLLLIAVGVLSALFGELRDAIAIFVVIGLVSAVEAISEIRATRALQALRDLSAPTAVTRRAGAVSRGRGRRARDR